MRISFLYLVGLSGFTMLNQSAAVADDQDFLTACSRRIVSFMGSAHLRDLHTGFEMLYELHGDGSREVQFSLSAGRGRNSRVIYRDMNDDGIVDSMYGEWDSESGLLPLSRSDKRFIFVNTEIIPVQKGRGWHNYPTAVDGTIYQFTNGTWEKSGVASRPISEGHSEVENPPTSIPADISVAIPRWVDVNSNRWQFLRDESDIPWIIKRHRTEDLSSVTLTGVSTTLKLSCSNDGKRLRLAIGESFAMEVWYSDIGSVSPLRFEVALGNHVYDDLNGEGIIDLIRERDGKHGTIRVGRRLVHNCMIGPDRDTAIKNGTAAISYAFVKGDWMLN